jgi:hypothetical protein
MRDLLVFFSFLATGLYGFRIIDRISVYFD